MATHTSAPQYIAVGAGVIYWAPIGTVEPTWAASASKFTNTITTPWLEVGATEDGATFTEQRAVADLIPEETLVAEKVVTTSITASVSFSMWYIHDDNWVLAHNGGAWTTTGTSGSAINTYIPPTQGNETRAMLVWMAADNTHALWFPQCFNTANVAVPLKKGPNKSVLPVEFRLEQPTSGSYYKRITAGTSFMNT